MHFYLGCAVWAYKEWIGNFYPAGAKPSELLALYSQRLTAVEGNATFYAIPSRDTLQKWAAQTPEQFQFCLKLPKAFTHNGLLQPSLPAAIQFARLAQTLGNRFAPLFAQLPPSYSPDALDDLTAFLTAWQTTELPLAVEVRHPAWFEAPWRDRLEDLLTSSGIGRVMLDSRPIYTSDHTSDDPQQESQRRKPNLPLQFSVTAKFAIARFIAHPHLPINEPFLTEWVAWVKRQLHRGVTVYFFVHCPQEVRSPFIARHFQELLEEAGVPVAPLPWSQLEATPSQLRLF